MQTHIHPNQGRIQPLFVLLIFLLAAVLIVGIHLVNKDYACENCGRRVSVPEAHWAVDASGNGGWNCSPQGQEMKPTQGRKGTVQNMFPQPAKEPLIIDR